MLSEPTMELGNGSDACSFFSAVFAAGFDERFFGVPVCSVSGPDVVDMEAASRRSVSVVVLVGLRGSESAEDEEKRDISRSLGLSSWFVRERQRRSRALDRIRD